MSKTAFLLFTFFITIFAFEGVQAQQQASEEGRFVGVVIDGATTRAIPHATIKNKTQKESVLADSTGYFVIDVQAGDTLIFEAMAYASDFYIVPETFSGRHFAFIEVLQKEAIVLEEVAVLGFPSQEQFEAVFFSEGAVELAENTAELQEHLEEIQEDPTNMQSYLNDFGRNQMVYQLRDFPPHLHNPRPNHFLNPIRWSEFIKDWREGRFSEDAVEKLEGFPDPDPDEEPGILPREPEVDEGQQ